MPHFGKNTTILTFISRKKFIYGAKSVANRISAPPTIIIYSLVSNSKQFSGQYNSCVVLTHVSIVFIILAKQEFSEIKHDFLKIYFDDIVPTLVTGFFLSNLHCDQIGRFLEFLGNKFITKVTQMFDDFWGSCENHWFFKSNGLGYFLGNFWKNLGYSLFQHLVTLRLPCTINVPMQEHEIICSNCMPYKNGTQTDRAWKRDTEIFEQRMSFVVKLSRPSVTRYWNKKYLNLF